MMDRKKENDLPKMQVGFIDAICLPIYKVWQFQEDIVESMLILLLDLLM